MDDDELYECPMPETFRDKFGMTLFLAWLFYLGFVSRVIFGPLMPEIQKDLALNNAEAGALFFMLSLGYILAPVCSGLLSSRINHLGTLKLSSWLVGIGLLFCLFVDDFWSMGFLLMLTGFAGSLHVPSAIATITAEIQRSDWGKGLSVHQCAPPLSFVSAPLIAALLSQWLTWRQIIGCWAIIALVSALLYSFLGKGGEFPGRIINPATLKKIVALPSFWLMAVLFSLAMAGNAGIFAMLPLFLVTERGFELAMANTLIGLSQFSGIAAIFFAGIIVDKVGQKQVMGISLVCTGILTLAIGVAEGWLLIIVLFLQPATLTIFFPAAFGALSRITHPSMRSVTSAMGPPLAFLIGGGMIPAVIGRLAESSSFATGIMFAGTAMFLGPLLVFFVRLGVFDGEDGC
ncbi:MAG: MFS transporter [Proteobacteria bacterium]|nr:MFS transporter [Pseudomonadota bacterium]